MDEFSYLAVLLSIILGLAITQLLTGWRGRMLARARVRPFWPSDLWSGILLLIATQTWWAMFGLRARTAWDFGDFAIVLAQTIALYLLTGLVYPDFASDREVDLRVHYFAQRRHFFSVASLLVLISIARDLVLNHALPDPVNLRYHLFYLTAAILALLTARPWFHKIFAVVSAVVFISYILELFTRLR